MLKWVPQMHEAVDWNRNIRTAITWSAQINGASRVIRLHTPLAEHFGNRAPWLFGGIGLQIKAPHNLWKIIVRCWQTFKLRLGLHGNITKSNVLIFMRKIRWILKNVWIWAFVGLPVGSSTLCKNLWAKVSGFWRFCIFQAESADKCYALEAKLPRVCSRWNAIWVK